MRKRVPLLIVLTLLIVIAGLIIFNFDRLRGAVNKSTGDTDLEQLFDISITREATDDMDNVELGDAIYFTEKGRLYAYSLDNQPLWDIKMSDQVVLQYQAGRLMVAEEAVGNIYILNSAGELQASPLGLGELDTIELVETGQVVAVVRQSKEISTIDEILIQQAVSEVPACIIFNFHVNHEYNRLTTLILQDSEGELRTSVVLYNLKGEALQVISRPDIAINAYSYRDEILVVVPSGVIVYKEMLTRPVASIPMNNVKSTSLSGTTMFLETGSLDPTERQGELAINAYSMADRDIEFHNKLAVKYDKIVTQDDQILLLTKNNLEIQTTSGGQVLTKTYPVPIRKATILADGRIVLVFSDRISLNQLKH